MNTEDTHEKNAALTTGQRLRNAREQLGLSQQVVAERLCLKVSTVRQIEDDSLPADLAATFWRGYIRSYARVVHIPEEELLPAVKKDDAFRPTKLNSVQGMSLGKRRKKRDGWLWSFTVLVLIVVIGLTGAWWWQNHKAQQEEISTMVGQSAVRQEANNQARQSVPVDISGAQSVVATEHAGTDTSEQAETTQPIAKEQTSGDPVQTIAQETSGQTPVPSVTTSFSPEAQSPATVSTSHEALRTEANALVMNFKADCWLEVIDASGKTLYSGIQRKGGNLNLNGRAPYKLKIGAPAAVEIRYQGKSVDMSRFIKENQVARLTLKAEPSTAQ